MKHNLFIIYLIFDYQTIPPHRYIATDRDLIFLCCSLIVVSCVNTLFIIWNKNIREVFVFVVEVLDYLCHNTKAHGYSRAFRFQVWQEKLSRFQRHKEKRIAYDNMSLSMCYCLYLLCFS